MTQQNDLCDRVSAEVSAKLADAPAVVATTLNEGGIRHIFWAGSSCTVEDLEAVAEALLFGAMEAREANGAAGCAGCARRAQALRQALQAFASEGALSRAGGPAHLH